MYCLLSVSCLLLAPSLSRQSTYYDASDRPTVYSYIYCNGLESSIAYCSKNEYPYSNCYWYYSAGVLCTDGMLNY